MNRQRHDSQPALAEDFSSDLDQFDLEIGDALLEAFDEPVSSVNVQPVSGPGGEDMSLPRAWPEPAPEVQDAPSDADNRLTAYAARRFAEIDGYREANHASQKELGIIGDAIGRFLALQSSMKASVEASQNDVSRANRLEIENAAHLVELRRMADQMDALAVELARRETEIERLHARETRLSGTVEELTGELHATKLQLVETAALLSAAEARHGELETIAAARTALSERLADENDGLRKKVESLTAQLETASARHAGATARIDDLLAAQASAEQERDAAVARAEAAGKELALVQKRGDALEARLAEAEEAAAAAAVETREAARRHQGEAKVLRDENRDLNARLSESAALRIEAISDAMTLRARLEELEAEMIHLTGRPSEAAARSADGEEDQKKSAPNLKVVASKPKQEAGKARADGQPAPVEAAVH